MFYRFLTAFFAIGHIPAGQEDEVDTEVEPVL